MSTCGEKYDVRFSGVTPPLASICRAGNSSFSVRAAAWSSCGRAGDGMKSVFVSSRSTHEFLFLTLFYRRLKVVQHDDVCTGCSRFSGLLRGAALHLHLTAEPTHRPRRSHSLKNKQDVVVCVYLNPAAVQRATDGRFNFVWSSSDSFCCNIYRNKQESF